MNAAQRGFSVATRFEREMAPEGLAEYARQAEQAGFDELWVVEDCFFGGGIASSATALAATSTIYVGLGIMPAVARNPAFAAMDIATLARLYPGRFLPAFGHGVADWMRQVGAFPASQLGALAETTTAVRGLLRGETVTMHGTHVNLDAVTLYHPPREAPPIALGVRRRRGLMLAGRVADGTILTEASPPEYVSWAREQIERGQREASQTGHHRVTLFVYCSVDDDAQAARDRLRPILTPVIANAEFEVHVEQIGIVPEIKALLAEGGQARLQAAMPDAWIDALAAVGTPDECAASVRRFADAGADSVVLLPVGDQGLADLARVLRAV